MNRPRLSAHVARVALAVLTATMATGCTTAINVGLITARDGSGRVSVFSAVLDPEAARVVETAGVSLRADDLKGSGWVVTSEKPRSDGSAQYGAQRQVASVAEAEAALHQLGTPFQGITVTRRHRLDRTDTVVSGAVDLTGGIEAFGDDVVRQRLGTASAVGTDVASIERQGGKPIDQLLTFRVNAQVPGAAPASWAPSLGQRTPVELHGRVRHLGVIVRLALGTLTVLAAAVLAGAQYRVRRARNVRRGPLL